MLKLGSYIRHYAIPALVTGAFNFGVDGDYPNGEQCFYNADGILVPPRVAWPITLFSLQAELKVIATGNQLNGVAIQLWTRPSRYLSNQLVPLTIVSPFVGMAHWAGELPLEWGFGVTVLAAAGLTTTHKLVLSASYAYRGGRDGL